MVVEKKSETGLPLRDKLRNAFAKLKLPTSPALATKILELAEDPDAGLDKFASAIQLDAALSGRLLKMANSAQFGQRTAVTTIHRAVQVLGVSRVRTVALGFQLVGHLNKLGGCSFDIKTYWQHSALRGCLGRQIAQRVVPSLAEEAFLVGLLQDCGILLLVQLLGPTYAMLHDPRKLSPSAFYEKEREGFEFNHVDACATMAGEWKLPEVITAPLAKHHYPTHLGDNPTDVQKLCAVSYLIGSMRFVSNDNDDPVETSLNTYAQKQLNLTPEDLATDFEQAAKTYKEMAHILGDSLPGDLDVTDLLSEANRQLTTAADEAEEQVGAVTAERDEVRREQEQLKNALGEYRDRAARDPLTGLLNRGALSETASRMIEQSRQGGSSITAVFLDVDNFKKLNDRYGHKTGDDVLRAVAAAVTAIVPNGGCVGRYGGEEIVLIAPGLAETEGATFGESVAKAVRSIDHAKLGLESPVTCSVGAAWAGGEGIRPAESMFSAADELMYISKRGGKDRSTFKALSTAGDPASSAHLAPSAPSPPKRAAAAGSLTPARPLDQARMKAIAARLNQLSPAEMVEVRKQSRRELLAPCRVCVLRFPGPAADTFDAFVRNISTGGVGFLADRFLVRGEPVEVSISRQGQAILYVAGIVAYCRQVDGNTHDVGIQLTAHAKEPIFSHNPANAQAEHFWLASALQDLEAAPAYGGAAKPAAAPIASTPG